MRLSFSVFSFFCIVGIFFALFIPMYSISDDYLFLFPSGGGNLYGYGCIFGQKLTSSFYSIQLSNDVISFSKTLFIIYIVIFVLGVLAIIAAKNRNRFLNVLVAGGCFTIGFLFLTSFTKYLVPTDSGLNFLIDLCGSFDEAFEYGAGFYFTISLCFVSSGFSLLDLFTGRKK